MKKTVIISALTSAIILAVSAPALAQTDAALDTDKAKQSYAMGQQMAMSIAALDADYDIDALLLGIRDALEKKPSRMSRADRIKSRSQMVGSMSERRAERRKKMKAKQAKAGKAFRTKSRKRKGQRVTASGLQYKRLKKGKGARPGKKSRVKYHVTASLVDGTEFENTRTDKQPYRQRVKRNIPGLVEGLQLMRVGSKYRFVIPPELAYGDVGLPGKVPPGATVVYEVELISIKNKN